MMNFWIGGAFQSRYFTVGKILHCRSDKNWRPPLKSFANEDVLVAKDGPKIYVPKKNTPPIYTLENYYSYGGPPRDGKANMFII